MHPTYKHAADWQQYNNQEHNGPTDEFGSLGRCGQMESRISIDFYLSKKVGHKCAFVKQKCKESRTSIRKREEG